MKREKAPGLVREVLRNSTLYLMFLPVALYFVLFSYLPMAGIVVAFKEFDYRGGILFSPWNGLDNFRFFFLSGKALSVTLNTFRFNLVFLVCYMLVSLMTAIMISEIRSRWFRKTAQTLMFLPYFISWVVASAFVYNLLSSDYGMVNSLLKSIGARQIDIYSNPRVWNVLLPVLYTWKWVGFGSVLYLAAISAIDPALYEAATIDGASIVRKTLAITLPLLRPTIITLVLLGIGRILRGEFDMFYNLIGNNGLLIDSTDIIDTLVFRSLVGTQDFGMASAAAFYQSVLCFVIIIAVNAVVKRVERENALF